MVNLIIISVGIVFVIDFLLFNAIVSREFDEILLRRISEVFYEDEVVNLPPAPDVSNYLMSEVCELKISDFYIN